MTTPIDPLAARRAQLQQQLAAFRAPMQQQQTPFNSSQFLNTFNSLPNDAAKYAFYRSQPLGAANAALTDRFGADSVGQWNNQEDYNGTLGGVPLTNVQYRNGGFYGPNGQITNLQAGFTQGFDPSSATSLGGAGGPQLKMATAGGGMPQPSITNPTYNSGSGRTPTGQGGPGDSWNMPQNAIPSLPPPTNPTYGSRPPTGTTIPPGTGGYIPPGSSGTGTGAGTPGSTGVGSSLGTGPKFPPPVPAGVHPGTLAAAYDKYLSGGGADLPLFHYQAGSPAMPSWNASAILQEQRRRQGYGNVVQPYGGLPGSGTQLPGGANTTLAYSGLG